MQTVAQHNQARVAVESSFAWDGADAYLFDIDGTLIRSGDRVHFDSFATTLKLVMGSEVTLDGVSLAGNTDTSILREACELAGIPREAVEASLPALLEGICRNVAERSHEMEPVLMPGVEATLRHLAGRRATLGLATGNLEMIGWIKMERAGLRKWFQFGGFSDKFPLRSDMVRDAARQARDLAGPDASVCVVGDTPRDIEAARRNGLPVIAVATGHFSFDQLLEHKPDVCTTTLAALLEMGRERA